MIQGGGTAEAVAYGWRTDLAASVEHRPSAFWIVSSALLSSQQRVAESPIYEGKRSINLTEWRNTVRLKGYMHNQTIRPYADVGVSYLSNPALLDPGARKHLMGQVSAGMEMDVGKGGRVFTQVQYSDGLSHFRSTRLECGVAMSF